MKRRTLHVSGIGFAVSLLALATATGALAQDAPAGAAPGEGASNSGNSVTVVQVPAAAPVQQQTVYGPLPQPGWDPNGHLPNSSRAVTDINGSNDEFDLKTSAGGPTSVHGSANSGYSLEGGLSGSAGGIVPELHTVRRGETLWEISGRYYNNPYQWPRVWGQNPQIQNPHWIYPGDRVRLREEGARAGNTLGFRGRRASVPPGTVFLRDQGWVDDKNADDWGQVVGSPEDVMILRTDQDIYIQLKEGHDMAIGELLTIWRPIRTVESNYAHGELVSIRGTAKIDRFNPRTRMVRAKIVEAIDVIERGARVGPVGRRFEVVPPVPSDVDLDAHILAAIYPYQFYGQNQVVFLDRGEREGVKPGMRFFAVMRADPWIDHLGTAGVMAHFTPRTEDDRPARVDPLFSEFDSDLLPDETYAEIRVIKTREHTCAAIVTASKLEIEHDAHLVARKGL